MPVVCVTGAFTLTPLFAHNQSSVLNQLLSPADALPYNANIDINNVEVKVVRSLLFRPFLVYPCSGTKTHHFKFYFIHIYFIFAFVVRTFR